MNKEKNNKKFAIIAAAAGLIIIGYGIFVYLFVFPSGKKNDSGDAVETVTRLDPSKVRLDVESGAISIDRVLNLTLKLSGLENKETAEELSKNDNLRLEINQNQAEIAETQISNEDVLMIRAKIPLSDDVYNNFSGGQTQNLEVRTDLQYDAGKTATKMLSTSFKKKDSTNSLGQEIAFVGNTENSNNMVTTANTNGTSVAPPTASKPNPQKTVNNKDVYSKTTQRNRDEENYNRAIPVPRSSVTNSSRRRPPSEEEDVVDDLKRNKVVKKSTANN